MDKLIFTITDAGRQEIINASNTGTEKVEIKSVGIGDMYYITTPDQTEIGGEIKRITGIGGTVISPDTIHVTAKDDTKDEYVVHTVGLYTDKGTLFAVYSRAEPIINKSASTVMLISSDITFKSIDTANITFGDVVFINPPASESVVGVSRFATAEEVEEGLDPAIAVSAKRLKGELDKKANLDSPNLTGTPTAPTTAESDNSQKIATTAFIKQVLLAYAKLASPNFTGKPTAPIADQSSNDTQLATTAFVRSAIAALVDSSPGALDTLNELAAALGDDPNFATTMTNALAGKQPLDGTLTNLSGKDVPALLQYLGLGETINLAAGAMQKDQNGGDIPDKDLFVRRIGAARAFDGAVTIGGDANPWTTEEFIVWLESQGAFNHPYWMCRGVWSYALNKVITDTGCGNICPAGAVIEVMGVRGAMTIRITTSTTTSGGGVASAQFTYINNGDGYAPGWRREFSRTGDEMTGNLYLKNDGRVNFCIMNEDGTPRMWLFKDKGGDGIHINNGNDGGGDYVFHKDGSFYAPLAVRAGGSKKLAVRSDNNSALSAHFNLWGDANRPTVIELDDDQGWHLYSQRNPDGSILFTVNGDIMANRKLNVGDATFSSDGNINGSLWGGWLNDWVDHNFVRAVRLGPVALSGGLWRDYQLGGGQVVTGFHTDGNWEMEGGDDKVYYRPIQYLVGGTWVTAPSV
ncbi:phage tail protein [Salmonella enterica subsp. enterica serovar Muenchen]|nr:phage tail protein [Salmonella enterica subsp. enterica serovar Muenchen]EDO2869037.1 phage tail protein [Salmonella enterica subsp. enterica serovar Muenchen]EDQ0868842.1 phage tail protein [Salmonella enterica]EEE6771675.1 phage tail protein [Salmonella enterica subsp. enterica serovar Muenchen]